MKLIGVMGNGGSGKTTFTNYLDNKDNVGVIHVDDLVGEVKKKYFGAFLQPKENNTIDINELLRNISKGYQSFEYNAPKTTLKILEDKPIVKENKDINFKIGDKINHKVFGDGLVVKIEEDIIHVAFKMPTGIKKLKANHPSIMKK